jgi:hypothetical protein
MSMEMHIYFLSLTYLLWLLPPGILQYTPLSLNIIIIIIHSMAFKLSAPYTIIFSRS